MIHRLRQLRVIAALVGGLVAVGSLVAQAQRAGGAPPQNTQTTTPLEGTAAISGLVVDADGHPLESAIVTVQSAIGALRGAEAGPWRQSTDARGRFIFVRLPAGTYLVAAVKIGYLDGSVTGRVVLTDGQWAADTKITLQRPSAINGTVTDEHGEPAVGVFVRVLAQVLVAGMPQLAGGLATRTDDRGAYRLPGLTAGKYVVVVPSVQSSFAAETTDATLSGLTPEMLAQSGRSAQPRNDRLLSVDGKNLLWLGGYLPPPSGTTAMAYPATYFPAARTPREASVIDLKASEDRTGIDLQIRPVPVVRVSGVLDAPPEAQPAGMTLRLMAAGTESLSNGSEVATTLVSADRTFTFLNVPAGDYTIIASRSQMEYTQRATTNGALPVSLPSPPGSFAGSSGGGVISSAASGIQYSYRNSNGARTHTARVPVSVGTTDVTGVVVTLRKAVTLSGTIVFDTEKPPQANGPPGGSPVYADPADGNAALGLLSGRMVPGENTFSIDGLLSGPYTLRFLGLAGRIKSVTWDGKDYTDRAFDASAGRDITGVVVTVTDKTTKATGFVRDAKGQIATHGSVIAFPTDSTLWTGYGFQPRRIASANLGSNGAFTFNSLSAGAYLLIAVDESLATAWQDPKFLAAAVPFATKVTVDWGGTQTTDLEMKKVPGFGKDK